MSPHFFQDTKFPRLTPHRTRVVRPKKNDHDDGWKAAEGCLFSNQRGFKASKFLDNLPSFFGGVGCMEVLQKQLLQQKSKGVSFFCSMKLINTCLQESRLFSSRFCLGKSGNSRFTSDENSKNGIHLFRQGNLQLWWNDSNFVPK